MAPWEAGSASSACRPVSASSASSETFIPPTYATRPSIKGHLAMIALKQAAAQHDPTARGIEDEDRSTRLDQRLECRARERVTSIGIDEEDRLASPASRLGERLDRAPSHAVVREDVVLEPDLPGRRFDLRPQAFEVVIPVDAHLDAVARGRRVPPDHQAKRSLPVLRERVRDRRRLPSTVDGEADERAELLPERRPTRPHGDGGGSADLRSPARRRQRLCRKGSRTSSHLGARGDGIGASSAG